MKKHGKFLILLLIFCIGCENRKNGSSSLTTVDISTYDVENTENISIFEEESTIKEIINFYISVATDLPSFCLQNSLTMYTAHIEGNFTNSGNREFIGFYGYLPTFKSVIRTGGISGAFCFVLDSNDEKIENVYSIKYVSISLTEKVEEESALIGAESLGRPIKWEDRLIGYVSDFNGDGKDELYLYTLYGFGCKPVFFGFDEVEFVELIDLPFGISIYITSVDQIEKTIDIQTVNVVEDRTDPRTLFVTTAYHWDAKTKRYEILHEKNRETKRYRWNWDTKKYDEIS
jgi:hypothetical protein